ILPRPPGNFMTPCSPASASRSSIPQARGARLRQTNCLNGTGIAGNWDGDYGRAASLRRYEYSTEDGPSPLVELALACRVGAWGDVAARRTRGLDCRGLGTRPDLHGDALAHGIRGRNGGLGVFDRVGRWGARVFLSHGPAGTQKMVH